MAYASSTYSNPNDLLQQLVTFLSANGWTNTTSASDGPSWKASHHKSGKYVNFRTANNESGTTLWADGTYYNLNIYGLMMYLGSNDGAAGSPWYNGSGAPADISSGHVIGSAARMLSGSGTYFFFTDTTNDNCFVLIEHTPGVFTYVGWGTGINAAGAITNGQYFFGSQSGHRIDVEYTSPIYCYSIPAQCPMISSPASVALDSTAFIKTDVDTWTSKWLSNDQNMTGSAGRYFASSMFGSSAPSANIPRYDGLYLWQEPTSSPLLVPVEFYVSRDAGGYSLLGTLPNIYPTEIVGHGANAGDEYSISSDTYKVFPHFAVKKVP